MAMLWMRREGEYRLAAASRADALNLARMKKFVRLRVEVKEPRSGKFHRLIWQTFTLVAEALNAGPSTRSDWTAEDVADLAKLATGRGRVLPAPPRVPAPTIFIPASISYAAMDQAEFDAFARAFFDYIEDLAPWLQASPQWAEIQAILSEVEE